MNQPELDLQIKNLLTRFDTDSTPDHQDFFETLAATNLSTEQLQTLAQQIQSRIEKVVQKPDNE